MLTMPDPCAPPAAHAQQLTSVALDSRPSLPSLADAYCRYFPIGAAVDAESLSELGDLLTAQVSSVVPVHDMSWERIHPRPGSEPLSYDFSRADCVAAFASRRGMKLRGHTLVWHRQTPEWVFESPGVPATRPQVIRRMEDHISTVLAHFRDTVYCWDVVNQALSDGAGAWRTDSPWQRIAGADQDGDGVPDYITRAFAAARAGDPRARLFYSDDAIEDGSRRELVTAMVRALKVQGLIDGVGIQGHWSVTAPDPETVRQGIRHFASLGVEVQVTEMELSVYRRAVTPAMRGPTPRLLERQAARYAALFRVFREEARAGRLTGVTFAGISDGTARCDGTHAQDPTPDPARDQGRPDWPLLFDEHRRPKKAFWSIVKWQ